MKLVFPQFQSRTKSAIIPKRYTFVILKPLKMRWNVCQTPFYVIDIGEKKPSDKWTWANATCRKSHRRYTSRGIAFLCSRIEKWTARVSKIIVIPSSEIPSKNFEFSEMVKKGNKNVSPMNVHVGPNYVQFRAQHFCRLFARIQWEICAFNITKPTLTRLEFPHKKDYFPLRGFS